MSAEQSDRYRSTQSNSNSERERDKKGECREAENEKKGRTSGWETRQEVVLKKNLTSEARVVERRARERRVRGAEREGDMVWWGWREGGSRSALLEQW